MPERIIECAIQSRGVIDAKCLRSLEGLLSARLSSPCLRIRIRLSQDQCMTGKANQGNTATSPGGPSCRARPGSPSVRFTIHRAQLSSAAFGEFVQSSFEFCCQFICRPSSPVVEEDDHRLCVSHVVVDRNHVESMAPERLQHRRHFCFQHRDVRRSRHDSMPLAWLSIRLNGWLGCERAGRPPSTVPRSSRQRRPDRSTSAHRIIRSQCEPVITACVVVNLSI